MKAKNEEYKKGLWTEEEDKILMEYITLHGKGKWNRVPQTTGLRRCGKSCRLRWMNYLSPNIKRGDFSDEEDDLIIRLHNLLGNRWSLIAGRVPGRTDNQIKNHWNTHLSKKFIGLKKGKCGKARSTRVVSMTTYNKEKKKKSSPTPALIPFPQQPTEENEEAVKSKTDSHEPTTTRNNDFARTTDDKDWIIDFDDDMNFFTDQGWMNLNYGDDHHLDFVGTTNNS